MLINAAILSWNFPPLIYRLYFPQSDYHFPGGQETLLAQQMFLKHFPYMSGMGKAHNLMEERPVIPAWGN